ncbi:anti-sigma factor antagonist [Streptomyces sp. NBC_00638]|uniref:anti-sigma factor antagonist n=1 Tax=unclassified Streptomyces TaxID=2593676 RepID=UPI00224E18F3|nr:anti-sigma factor antagonist [Streptomyces sp. NBC_00638]MCX5007873.1 anti-sigma factor antagonist [Streptomyces sp. NBC_00638]
MASDPAPRSRYLRIHHDRGHVVLELHGEIDLLATTEITSLLDSATSGPAPQVVIDLRCVEFFDCSGLRLLYRARHRVLARDGRLHLVCTLPLTLRMLRATGLARILPPSASLEEALSRSEARETSEAISDSY